jgi:catechol 2,3-dioxygenase
MMKLQRLGHVVLRVADIERSKKFYMDVLGLDLVEQDPAHGGVFLGLGDFGHVIDLLPSSAPNAGGPYADITNRDGLGLHHFAFAMESEEALKQGYFTLVDQGVRILGALEHESQQSVYFPDPDGNVLEIYWERPNAADIFREGRSDEDKQLVFER